MKKIVSIASVILSVLIVIGIGLGFVITPQVHKPVNDAVEGIKPFSSSQGVGSNYYRIPSVITTDNGTIVSAIDARFGGTHDSPNNLDTAVSISKDRGISWKNPKLVLSFEDWKNDRIILKSNSNLKTNNSASAIDPCLLEDKITGRVFMLVDVYPYATGSLNSEPGSGFTEIAGKKYMQLKKKGSNNDTYTVREDGIIYDSNAKATAYSLNDKFEILQKGKPLYVNQKKAFYWYNFNIGIKTNEKVAMNIMYQNALFKPLKTSYLYLLYSDDNGETWSNPINLNSWVKPENESFMGVCPGRGIQIENGDHKGRLIFTTYYLNPQNMEQRFTAVYSDDHGETWQTGHPVELTEDISSASETQLVQFPDGSLQSFSRTTVGYVAVAHSYDGGITWSTPVIDKKLVLASGSGCQLSAINFRGKVDCKDAVLLSAPAGEDRKNGFIYVGLIDSSKGTYQISWKYKKEITDKNTHFAYSCLTQLDDKNIGLLYEQANAPQTIDTVVFKTYTMDELCTEAITE